MTGDTLPTKATVVRQELQGLRVVAVLLVASYHVWFGRVSGGVDVFLLLTGFLITGSLLRMVEREGRVKLVAFWTRLLRRLAPAAGIVLAGSLLGTYLWLPDSQLPRTFDEITAAVLYHENWQLARTAIDYNASTQAASPVQQFWSLGVQGQFYLLWALLVGCVAWWSARTRLRLRRTVFILAAIVTAASLGYSILITEANQPWAYFDTGARLWEPGLGAMLAVALPRIRLRPGLRVGLGWIGIAGLLAVGATVDASRMFPGYLALWPVLAAAALVTAGATGHRFGVDRLLAWPPMARLGVLAYPFYLWHWPVLVFARAIGGSEEIGAAEGIAIIAVSAVLAVATKWLVTATTATRRTGPAWGTAVVALAIAPVLLAASTADYLFAQQAKQRAIYADDPADYPGAAVVDDPVLAANLPQVPVYPDPTFAAWDVPRIYTGPFDPARDDPPDSLYTQDSCEIPGRFKMCEYGDPDAVHTIAMVGMSRVAQWFGALAPVAEAHGWRLLVMSKSNCQFSTDVPMWDGEINTECRDWLESAMSELDEQRPDVVFTSSTLAQDAEQGYPAESVPEGFVNRWRELGEWGIDVVGVRDLPRLGFRPADCYDQPDCTEPAIRSQAETDPAAELADLPGNVDLIDLTDYVCPQGQCRAVIGNVLVWRDYKHLTDTYAQTLAPMMDMALVAATGWP